MVTQPSHDLVVRLVLLAGNQGCKPLLAVEKKKGKEGKEEKEKRKKKHHNSTLNSNFYVLTFVR